MSQYYNNSRKKKAGLFGSNRAKTIDDYVSGAEKGQDHGGSGTLGDPQGKKKKKKKK